MPRIECRIRVGGFWDLTAAELLSNNESHLWITTAFHLDTPTPRPDPQTYPDVVGLGQDSVSEVFPPRVAAMYSNC